MGEYAFDAGHESEITGSDLRNPRVVFAPKAGWFHENHGLVKIV